MQYEYINLTGHEINELRSGLTIPAHRQKLEVTSTTKYVTNYDGATVEVVRNQLAGDIPTPRQGVIYIVNQLTLGLMPSGRPDIVAPKRVVRDKTTGTIKGCIGFRMRE